MIVIAVHYINKVIVPCPPPTMFADRGCAVLSAGFPRREKLTHPTLRIDTHCCSVSCVLPPNYEMKCWTSFLLHSSAPIFRSGRTDQSLENYSGAGLLFFKFILHFFLLRSKKKIFKTNLNFQ